MSEQISDTCDKAFVLRVPLYFLLLLLIMAAGVRGEQLPVQAYTTADGLGSSAIISIMRDSRGFLWFCTRDGLSRFDGVRFITYNIGRDPSYPTINHILETRGGDYLIAPYGGGIYRFDPSRVSPHGGPVSDDAGNRVTLNAEKVSDSSVVVLFEDRAGNLWAGADGLYQLEDDGGRLRQRKIDLNIPERSGKQFGVVVVDIGAYEPDVTKLGRRYMDFDGDYKADVAIFRPSAVGEWWVNQSRTRPRTRCSSVRERTGSSRAILPATVRPTSPSGGPPPAAGSF